MSRCFKFVCDQSRYSSNPCSVFYLQSFSLVPAGVVLALATASEFHVCLSGFDLGLFFNKSFSLHMHPFARLLTGQLRGRMFLA